MMISRRSFLKAGARAGAAALLLAFPGAAYAEGEKEQTNALDGASIQQSASEDGYLRIKLDSISRSVYKDEEPSCLVLLGFTVTNLTGETVWLYHLHSNPFGEYYDGSGCIGGTFGDQAFQAQITRNDKMVQAEQTSEDGSGTCVSYGVGPGETIQVNATGSMNSAAGTLTLTFTPPEQPGANAGAHNTIHTFEVAFSEPCTSGSLQIAYL